MLDSPPFIPGSVAAHPGPLERFLPPIPDGVVSTWLDNYTEGFRSPTERAWILDPFCASPRVAIEIASTGYCVLVTAMNPITRFILEMAADPPTRNELLAAVAAIGSNYRGKERIEPHIKSLYQTKCNSCNHSVLAESFIWERDRIGPIKRVYNCSNCGETGEFPSKQEDIEQAKAFSKSGLHRARALERVAPLNDPDRNYVYDALEMYLDRSLYAIFTLINKIDGLSGAQKNHLTALMLSVCDRASNLWHYPKSRARPRKLTTPSQFYEHNVWLALESAIEQWSTSVNESSNIPITIWPDLPPASGGICIYEGRLKEYVEARQLSDLPIIDFIGAVLIFPRPNQAFWTLSALWAGWLFGQPASAPFKRVIRRRRYDWGWHTEALYSVERHLNEMLTPNTPMLGFIGELEPNFLSAAILSSYIARINLSGLAVRVESDEAQIHLQTTNPAGNLQDTRIHNNNEQRIVNSIRLTAISHLEKRAEPVDYNVLHAVALSQIGEAMAYPIRNETSPSDIYSRYHNLIQSAFAKGENFIRYEGSEHSLDVGSWWLKETATRSALSLTDKIESEVLNFLLEHPESEIHEIDAHICNAFPGLFTPNKHTIEECLFSYGLQTPEESGNWQIKPRDKPEARRKDISSMGSMLQRIGKRLFYTADLVTEQKIHWLDVDRNIKYTFLILTTAIISPILFDEGNSPQNSIILLPGSRSNLIIYRIMTNHLLKEIIEKGWRFVKFRHIRRLAEDEQLTKTDFLKQITLDPLQHREPQLPLL